MQAGRSRGGGGSKDRGGCRAGGCTHDIDHHKHVLITPWGHKIGMHASKMCNSKIAGRGELETGEAGEADLEEAGGAEEAGETGEAGEAGKEGEEGEGEEEKDGEDGEG